MSKKKRVNAEEKLRRQMQQWAANGTIVRDEDGQLLRFVRIPGGYKCLTLRDPLEVGNEEEGEATPEAPENKGEE